MKTAIVVIDHRSIFTNPAIKENIENLEAQGYEYKESQPDYIVMVKDSSKQERIDALEDENKELRTCMEGLHFVHFTKY